MAIRGDGSAFEHPCCHPAVPTHGRAAAGPDCFFHAGARLERECQRNVELMWLTGRLAPDFKTIADFRHDNGAGILNVCRRFVSLCRDLKLFSHAIVAIDGSKFKAVNNRDRNFTSAKLQRRMEEIEASIERYLAGR